MYNQEKILIVDDEIGILNLLEITLEKERYNNITCATTGKQTLNLIQNHSFDLILLDVMLPDFNGFDLCYEIRKHTNTNINQKEYNYGYFVLKPEEATLIVAGEIVECTAKELELLSFFCRNPNRIFTISQIYELVWGEFIYGEEKTVTIHISKIRKKLKDNPKSPTMIINLRGIGYKFIPPAKGTDK